MTERKLRRPGTGARLFLFCAIAWLSGLSLAMASEYHGQVTFGGLPVPGSTVRVTATQGDKTAVAITDTQGFYSFADLADGKWTLTIEMTGFAPVKQEVTVAPNAPAGAFELKLLTLEQMRATAKPVMAEAAATASTQVSEARPGAPATPSTQVSEAKPGATAAAGTGAAPAASASAAAKKGAAAKPAEAVTAAPETPVVAPEQDANAQQANDGFLINGSQSNAATSQYSMSQAFGNMRSGGRFLYNGGLSLTLNNSALDARQYSLTGLNTQQQSFNNFSLGGTFGGPLKLSHVIHYVPGSNFSVSYQRTQQSTLTTQPALVPTAAEWGGDLSQAPNVTAIYVPSDLSTVAPNCNSYLLGTGLTQSAINSGAAQFAGNIIPSQCISTVAQNLFNLKFYPLPNSTGLSQYNYQTSLASDMHQDGFGTNINTPVGHRDYLYGNFNMQSSRSGSTNLFGFHDSTDTLGMSSNVNWMHRFKPRLWTTATYSFNRSRNRVTPFFANRENVEGDAGITNSANNTETNWGPPSLSFSSSIYGLSDATSSNNRNETNSLTSSMEWYHLRHDITVGGDLRRREFNYLSQSNPEGSLGFNGTATQLVPPCPPATSPCPAPTGGSDFADFLLGIPDTSNIAYGNADKYLRQSLFDLYASDDFRVNPELSVKWGVRWEYGAPITELKGRLVNLDVAPGFTAEQPVVAAIPYGPVSGQTYPASLVHPDKNGIAPNIGIAWRPVSGSSLLVRSGYQIGHDTSVYQSTAMAMAQQHGTLLAPLSTSLSVSNSAACPFTIANPFSVPCAATTADTFAMDPNFRVGYIQIWLLSVQRDLPGSLVMVATYTGNKGTRGVQEFIPNTAPPGAPNPYASLPHGYLYRTSNGNSTHEEASLQLRRRPRNGLAAGATYTFAKSLDDDYSLGGGGSVGSGPNVAQNWNDLSNGQRGLSTFDQRHVLSANAQYTTGMGLGGKMLMSGWKGLAYKEWTVSVAIKVASGLPETPVYGGAAVSGTGFSGSIRPDVTGVSPTSGLTPGYHLNAAAYLAPSGHWGDARRDSITGPNQFNLNATMARTFRLGKNYNLFTELDATNVLNHVTYTGWNTTFIPGSLQFGEPLGTNGMRTVQLTARLRF
jgi:hypothetical protein